jgi:hypothetical protein
MLLSSSSKTSAASFVGDHMPPKSVAQQMEASTLRRLGILPRKVQFRFYPQCVSCSNVQGSILSKATHALNAKVAKSGGWRISSLVRVATLKDAGGGSSAFFHGWRFRINHMAGGAVAATTVVGATDRDIARGNPKRLERWQHNVEKFVKTIIP